MSMQILYKCGIAKQINKEVLGYAEIWLLIARASVSFFLHLYLCLLLIIPAFYRPLHQQTVQTSSAIYPSNLGFFKNYHIPQFFASLMQTEIRYLMK